MFNVWCFLFGEHMLRTCTKCKKDLPFDQFNKEKLGKHGLKPYCKACQSKYNRKYNRKKKNDIANRKKKYLKENREKIRDYKYKRYHSNLDFRIKCILRARINKVVKGESKSDNTMSLVGCSVDELKIHLESQFQEGMSWDNYGIEGWHVDHIKPCASFDMSDPEEQKKCFHYSNLQPLWAKDNLEKGDKCLK
jgi:hypothetical protein